MNPKEMFKMIFGAGYFEEFFGDVDMFSFILAMEQQMANEGEGEDNLF